MAEAPDWYDFGEPDLPDDCVWCDECNGDGWVEWGDDVIQETVLCPVCAGEQYITKARWAKRAEAHRELMKRLWGNDA